MRKFKGLLCSVSMAAMILAAGSAVYAEETETEVATTEAVSEAEAAEAEETAAPAPGEAVVNAVDIIESDQATLKAYAEQSIEMIVSMSDEQIEEQLNPTSILVITQNSMKESLISWKDNKEELGEFQGFISHDMSVNKENIVIKSTCQFSNEEGLATMLLNKRDLSMESLSFGSAHESLGKKMSQAAMNTVMGIGIVFLTLLFLSWLIGRFKYISKFEEGLKKKNAPAPAAAPAPAPAAAPVVEEEEVVDDGELIAVIAAAIAAAEGTTTDGFVVRSIKKHNRNKWQRA